MRGEGSPDHNRSFSSAKLYVGEIGNNRRNDLLRIFEKFGAIQNIYVDSIKRYAFVEYLSNKDAAEAIRRTDGRNVNGSRIRVEFARRESGSPRRGGRIPNNFRDRHRPFGAMRHRSPRRRSPMRRRSRGCFSPGSRRWSPRGSPMRRSPRFNIPSRRSITPPTGGDGNPHMFPQRSPSDSSVRQRCNSPPSRGLSSHSPSPVHQNSPDHVQHQFAQPPHPTPTMIQAPNAPPGNLIPVFQYPPGSFEPFGSFPMGMPYMTQMMGGQQPPAGVIPSHQQIQQPMNADPSQLSSAIAVGSANDRPRGDTDAGIRNKKRRRKSISHSPDVLEGQKRSNRHGSKSSMKEYGGSGQPTKSNREDSSPLLHGAVSADGQPAAGNRNRRSNSESSLSGDDHRHPQPSSTTATAIQSTPNQLQPIPTFMMTPSGQPIIHPMFQAMYPGFVPVGPGGTFPTIGGPNQIHGNQQQGHPNQPIIMFQSAPFQSGQQQPHMIGMPFPTAPTTQRVQAMHMSQHHQATENTSSSDGITRRNRNGAGHLSQASPDTSSELVGLRHRSRRRSSSSVNEERSSFGRGSRNVNSKRRRSSRHRNEHRRRSRKSAGTKRESDNPEQQPMLQVNQDCALVQSALNDEGDYKRKHRNDSSSRRCHRRFGHRSGGVEKRDGDRRRRQHVSASTGDNNKELRDNKYQNELQHKENQQLSTTSYSRSPSGSPGNSRARCIPNEQNATASPKTILEEQNQLDEDSFIPQRSGSHKDSDSPIDLVSCNNQSSCLDSAPSATHSNLITSSMDKGRHTPSEYLSIVQRRQMAATAVNQQEVMDSAESDDGSRAGHSLTLCSTINECCDSSKQNRSSRSNSRL